MLKIILYHWNLLLNKLIFNNIKKCDAICVINNKRCDKIIDSKYRYCKNHYNILKEFCNKYHYLDNYYKFKNISYETLAEVEYVMRIQFQLMFSIKSDSNHEYRLNQLRYIIINKYKKSSLEYMSLIDDDIKHLEYLNLELNLENKIIYNFNNDNLKINKYIINLYYFNNKMINYYIDIKNIQYLDISFSKKKSFYY